MRSPLYLLSIGSLIAAISLSGCGKTNQSAPPLQIATTSPEAFMVPTGMELAPDEIDAEIPETTYKEGLGRTCNQGVPTISFNPADINGNKGSGYVVKNINDGKVTYDIRNGDSIYKGEADLATITFEGKLEPVAVIVNSQKSALIPELDTNTIVLSGETFGSENKIYGVRICFK